MRFAKELFFERYLIDQDDMSYFDELELLDVIYLKIQDRIIVKISLEKTLPFRLHQQLKDYIAKALDHEVELYYKTRVSELALCEAISYIKDYANKHQGLFKSVLPHLDQEGICLEYDDIKHYESDKEHFDELIAYFNDLGYHQKFCFDYAKDRDIVIETREIKNKEKAPVIKEVKTPYRRKSDPKNYTKVKIDDLNETMEKICVEGIIFKADRTVTKNNTTILTLYIKDEDNACIAKLFESARFKSEDLAGFKEGKKALFYGTYRYDTFTNDYLLFPDLVDFVDYERKLSDDADEKRVELHTHSNKSEMDGVCDVEEIVTAAFDMGHKAVAITDHYVAQAFPKAQRTLEALRKKDPDLPFKIIYGAEVNVFKGSLDIVYNPDDRQLNNETYVVFDLETTGLSTYFDSIIEFGAVLMERGNIIERRDFFIKPPQKLSAHIRALTHIDDKMLEKAKPFKEMKEEILDFIKDHTLVAHNASFDFGFLNEELKRSGAKPLNNPVIDTLDLARSMFKRRSYRLGNMAKLYGVEYNEEVAHRADYDAEVLASVFNLMLKDVRSDNVLTLNDLANYQEAEDSNKKSAFHTTLLVKNKEGLKDLFKLISIAHTKTLAILNAKGKGEGGDVVAEPRVLKATLNEYRHNLLVGSSCLNGEIFELAHTRSKEELLKAMAFYDYIEIQPLENYRHLYEYRGIFDKERLMQILRLIIDCAHELNKPCLVSGDVHYVFKDEKVLRDVYINAMGIGGAHHPLYVYDRETRHRAIMPDQHFRNTKEMLEAFKWLEDERLIKELVIDNPNQIADLIEVVNPIHSKLYTPIIDGSDDLLKNIVYTKAKELYGDPLDEAIAKRLKRELDAIIGNGYGVIYYVSHLLVKKSNEDGYLVGSRGSVGSSLVATMAGITEVNPLPPHYICPKCKHLEWLDAKAVASGYNLEDKICPECGAMMRGDGQDIPFETFLGFNGDKVPDIDLNFSGEYQEKAHLFTREVFGEDHVFRAGTISTVAEKTAFGYVSGYCEEIGIESMSKAQRQRLASGCEGVKRTTGQHPGGIIVIPRDMEVYDFTPVQYPANDPSAVWRTTHFDFHDIHDNVLKFDILGHVDPTAMRLLQNISGIDPKTIPMNDPKVMSLFYSSKALGIEDDLYKETTGACGLPEFGTRFVRGILELTRPKTFSELVQISGLSHGTDVWNNNAKDLIENGIALKDVIGCRDDIMVTLMSYGLPSKDAFDIMEKVRKGKGLTEEQEALMFENDVPKWYIESCKKIKYMFPKAHAVAYVIMAVRIAWFKVYYPEYYYVSYFSLRCDAYDIKIMKEPAVIIKSHMERLWEKIYAKNPQNQATKKEKDLYDVLEICFEMVERGYHLSNIDINRSLAKEFLVNPDDHHEIIPPFKILDGLGDNVAESIVKARNERPFISKEDLMNRTQLSNTLLRKFEELGVLDGLDESNQISLF